MKLRLLVISSVLLSLLVSCNSYQMLLKHQSHSVSVKTQGKHITAHLLVEDKTIHPKKGLFYFSFKGGDIFRTEAAINGTALHGIYKENYQNGALKELGTFHAGLKHGEWKTWYNNGDLKSVSKYHHGYLNGGFVEFDSERNEVKSARYCRGKLVGNYREVVSEGDTINKKYSILGKEKQKKEKIKHNVKDSVEDQR